MSTPSPLTRDGFIQAQDAIAQAAEEKAAQRQHAKKKLTARERLSLFFDDGVWHEVGQFIGGSVREGRIGSAVATGYGRVQGRMVAAYAQDFSVLGGTLGKVEGDKIVDLIDRGIRMRIPIVGIQDSGGARIQEGVVALAQYGRIFKKTCEASGLVPQISIILGPCAGGAVYQPALTDFIVMTRENSHMFVTGPDVVAATTGEKVTLDELGGAAIHNFQSGVAHHMADTEEEAIDYVRSLLDYLPSSCEVAPPKYEYIPNPEKPKWINALKTVALCVVIFFGAAFTIMAFNNDVSVGDVFSKFYRQVMGKESSGVTELEICYSIGLAIGITLFFNHVGSKKITPDPTPMQVEMRKYEKDIDTTFIENAERKGHSIDVN